MVWKPKEKELTAEEAIELARTELAPFWFGSPPLLAAVKNGARFSAHPLDQEFAEKNWLAFFVDPTDLSGEAAFAVIREWARRYRGYSFSFLIVLRVPFAYLATEANASLLVKRFQLPFPIMADVDGNLTGAFCGTDPLPRVALIHKGKPRFTAFGPHWTKGIETQIQAYLRETDPGLPLLPAMEVSTEGMPEDLVRVDLGRGKGARIVRTEPTEHPLKGVLHATGEWMQDADTISTSDPTATLALSTAGAGRFVLIAEARGKAGDPTMIMLEITGETIYDGIAGEHLVITDEGQGSARVEKPLMHALLKDLPPKPMELKLRFPQAGRTKVALFGLRLGT